MHQAAAFVAWVGAGRAVDKKGRLAAKVADDAVAYVAERSALPFGEILLATEIVPLAVAMEWVELRRTGLVRGARAAGLEAVVGGIADDIAVLRVWREALDLLLRPETPERQTGADLDRVAEFMDQAEPAASWAMTLLYETDEYLLFDDLFDAAIADSPLEGVTENLWAGILATTAVRTRLHSAWRHGALDARWSNVDDRGTDVGERAPEQGLQPWYVLEAPDLAFRLTPLGTWGVHEALAAEGNIAPIS